MTGRPTDMLGQTKEQSHCQERIRNTENPISTLKTRMANLMQAFEKMCSFHSPKIPHNKSALFIILATNDNDKEIEAWEKTGSSWWYWRGTSSGTDGTNSGTSRRSGTSSGTDGTISGTSRSNGTRSRTNGPSSGTNQSNGTTWIHRTTSSGTPSGHLYWWKWHIIQ